MNIEEMRRLAEAAIEDAAASLATPGSPMYWQIIKALEVVEALGYAKAIEEAAREADIAEALCNECKEACCAIEAGAIAISIRALAGKDAEPVCEWHPIECAPTDGTVLNLFARCKTATAYAPVYGWYHPGKGWIELTFGPNEPVGIVPSHWKPRDPFPLLPKDEAHD